MENLLHLIGVCPDSISHIDLLDLLNLDIKILLQIKNYAKLFRI